MEQENLDTLIGDLTDLGFGCEVVVNGYKVGSTISVIKDNSITGGKEWVLLPTSEVNEVRFTCPVGTYQIQAMGPDVKPLVHYIHIGGDMEIKIFQMAYWNSNESFVSVTKNI